MQSGRYCVYNETNECFLSLGTRLGHNPFAAFGRLAGRDAELLHDGYWLSPLSRLKTLGILSSHDLVYLDDHQTAVGVIESFLMPRLAPPQDKARSLLVLPEHTISASQTEVGDQLVICSPQVMEARLRKTAEDAAEIQGMTGETAIRSAARAERLSNFTVVTARLKSCSVTQPYFDSSFSAACEVEEVRERNEKDKSITTMEHLGSANRIPERRGSARSSTPALFAHYRIHGSMAVDTIRDISVSGLYLVTEERWPVGTRLTLTVELMEPRKCTPVKSVPVHLKVTRWGPDGLGLEFVWSQDNIVAMERDNLLLIRAARRKKEDTE